MTHDAVRGDDGEVLDQIRLTGVRAIGFHGVLASERAQGQEFVADVVVHLDTRAAAVGDDLARTVDYGVLAEQVAETLSSDPADLIETVAERIAAVALGEPAVRAVDVVLHKPSAPITVPFDDVAVAIRRSRARMPVVVPVTPLGASAASSEPGLDLPLADGLAPELAAPSFAAPALAVPVLGELAFPVPGEPDADASEPAASELLDPEASAPDELLPDPLTDPLTDPLEPETQEVETDFEADPLLADEPAPDSAAVPEAALQAVAPEALRERDRMDDIPASAVEVVIALGANVGDTQQTLRDAIAALDAIAEIDVVEVSPLARTAPVGGPEQDDYLNAVVLAHTTLSARELLHAAQDVEHSFGRERTVRWGPRTLDIDLIVYGSLTDVAEDLELPHPRAHERAFVLEPWSQVQPDAVLPGLGGGPVAQLAATAPDRTGIRWLALDWLGTEDQGNEGSEPQPAPAPTAAAPPLPAPAAAPQPGFPPVGPGAVPSAAVPSAARPPAAAPPAVDVAEAPVRAVAEQPAPTASALVQRTSALPGPASVGPPIDETRVAPIQSVPPQFAPAPVTPSPVAVQPLPPTFQPTFPAVRPTDETPPER